MKNQEQIFLQGEGDRYYRRNKNLLLMKEHADSDPVLALIKKNHLRPRRVLEIGCSNGWRCGMIQQRYRSSCLGIDPGKAALQEGRRLFKSVQFRQGVMERLPVRAAETFDLVIVHFVLHWVSRSALMKSLAEIDRTVADKGYLILGDFLPDGPTRTRYHHLVNDEVYTYKLDYSQTFLSTGLYRRVAQRVFDHGHPIRRRVALPQNRASCSLLRKSLSDFYAKQSLAR